jgi:hypothetical protein
MATPCAGLALMVAANLAQKTQQKTRHYAAGLASFSFAVRFRLRFLAALLFGFGR